MLIYPEQMTPPHLHPQSLSAMLLQKQYPSMPGMALDEVVQQLEAGLNRRS